MDPVMLCTGLENDTCRGKTGIIKGGEEVAEKGSCTYTKYTS